MMAHPATNADILLRGSLESGSGKSTRRASSVSIVGFGPNFFWAHDEGGPPEPIGEGEIAITQPLASELNLNVGDTVLLRVPAEDVYEHAGGAAAAGAVGDLDGPVRTGGHDMELVDVLARVGIQGRCGWRGLV